jgi:tetratricopeptide (TPR) repeat protein
MFEGLKEMISGGGYTDDLLKEADNFASQGKYSDALERLNKCIEITPNWSAPYRRCAWIYAIHNYELDDALNYINKGIKILSSAENVSNVVLASSYDVLGEVYFRKRDFKNAIIAFNNCSNLRSSASDETRQDYSTAYRLGVCSLEMQDYPSAQAFFTKAVALNPINPNIYWATANTSSVLANYLKAIDYYSKAINLAPNWNFSYPVIGHPDDNEYRCLFLYNCLVNKSFAYSNIDDYDNCLKCNEEAYAICQNEPTAPINIAALHAKKSNAEKVRRFLEEGISLVHPENNKNLIQTLLLDSDFSEYRKLILLLLQKQNKITQDEYDRHMRLLQDTKTSDTKQQENPSIIQFYGTETVIAGNQPIKELTMSEKATRNINTGGGGYHEQHHIKNEGGVIAETINGPVSLGSAQVDEFVNDLQKLKAELEKAKINKTFDEEEATKIERHINEAITQSNKPNPDKEKISEHIEYATDIAKSVSKFVETAKPIVDLLITAGKAIALF